MKTGQTKKENKQDIYLTPPMPRWAVELSFIIMVVAAVCTWTSILHWFEEEYPLWHAMIQTVGMLTMYVGIMLGMQCLTHRFTALWWAVIGLNVAGFFTMSIPAINEVLGLPVALALQPVYLPLGTGILLLYHGRLRQVGIWMIVRILTVTYLPILYDILQPYFPLLMLDILTVGIELYYAWVLRRALVGQNVFVD